MPLAGFICPKDQKKTLFDFCKKGCPERCLELPILYELMKSREVKEGVYSVTEILKPPRIAAWMRANDYAVNPFDMVFALFGTSFHAVMEDAGKTVDNGEVFGFERENYFEAHLKIAGREITLSGTPDQYNYSTDTLVDYKTLKYYYDLMYLMERKDWSGSTYHWQINMYRRYRFPDCKAMKLVALVKDYNRKLKKDKGIPPIVSIYVPWIENDTIDSFVQDQLTNILEAEADITRARDCLDSERWKDNIRCKEYCLVGANDQCPQWKEIQGI